MSNKSSKPKSHEVGYCNPPKQYQFQPGQSGNPGGRPKGLARMAREHSDKAIQVIVEALESDEVKIRLQAAREILDRGYGKPTVTQWEASNPLEDISDELLEMLVEGINRPPCV